MSNITISFLICITGPVVSGRVNLSTAGVAIQGKLRSQYISIVGDQIKSNNLWY